MMKAIEKEAEVVSSEQTARVTDGDHIITGLTSEEVAAEVAAGRVNVVKEKAGKSYGRIIADNLLTFFNLIYFIVTVVLVCLGAFNNLTYLFVVIPLAVVVIILYKGNMRSL